MSVDPERAMVNIGHSNFFLFFLPERGDMTAAFNLLKNIDHFHSYRWQKVDAHV